MKIDDTTYQSVLTLRYVAFKNWTDIAKELSFLTLMSIDFMEKHYF